MAIRVIKTLLDFITEEGRVISVKLLNVLLPNGEREESLGRGDHCAIEEAQHRHHAPHHVVHPVVLHPEDIQKDPRRIESHKEDKDHPHVEDDRILSDALIILLMGPHLVSVSGGAVCHMSSGAVEPISS